MSTDFKRMLFVLTVLLGLFTVFGVIVALKTGQGEPLMAALIFDTAWLGGAGAWALSTKIWKS